MAARLRLVGERDLRSDPSPTAGMIRREAVAKPPLWAGEVRTVAGGASGWHHHGDHESVIYVIRGRFVIESAEDRLEAAPGEFVEVPAGLIHRESNPGATESLVVVARAGSGVVSVSCDAPK